MRPAASLAELDARTPQACPRCLLPRPRWPIALAASACCLLLFFSLDSVINAATRRALPFAAGPHAEVTYKGQTIARTASPTDARHLAQSLNGLFVQLTPPPVEPERTATGARVHTAGVTLYEFTTATAADPLRTASQFAARVDPILRGKGPASDGCPSCHLNRTGEVIESARRRAHAWR